MKQVMKRAGAGTPSANRITLLRGVDPSGKAGSRAVFVENLRSPFGMALVGSDFYVANADGIVRFPYVAGSTRIDAAPSEVISLPGGPINHHWTKNVIASTDGARLYATVGSNSNVAEKGMAVEEGRAAIWEIDRATGRGRIFASGLRNPNGMAWGSDGTLWTVANERDELGSDLVPDYLTSVRDGGFYGWPYSYYGQHVDDRVQPQRPDLVAKAIPPDYALGPHTASLGLASSARSTLPAPFNGEGMFVGQHGSWNRKPHSGYRVIFVPFANGKPSGDPVEVLTGFLNAEGEAKGRPVGVAIDSTGALLVADDVGNVVWRVTASGAEARARGRAALLLALRPVLERGQRLLDVAARVQALVVVDHLAVRRDDVRDAVGVVRPQRHHRVVRLHHVLRAVGGDRELALARLHRELAERLDVVRRHADHGGAERLELGDRLGELVRLDRAADRERGRKEVEDRRDPWRASRRA
jgi:glucose/arabinose dehydrogenase